MAVFARNVTVDPAASASAVHQPEIDEVIDLIRGEVLNSTALITSHRYDALIEKRVAIREGMNGDQPLFACALCGTPVYIASSPIKHFFFRHKIEDGSCPAQTRSSLSEAEIRARKYHGLRESEAHKRIKRLIERSLAADSRFESESIFKERRLRSERDSRQWRQPDVQAICGGRRMAFEAQLSTTFLDVVVERRMFYRKEDALLIWIVDQFDAAYRRLMTDDLLFSNNSNILAVDDETTLISELRGTFHLRCHYRQHSRDGAAIRECWDQRICTFHELMLDIDLQQAYLIDCKGVRERLAIEADDELRAAFFDLWESIQFPYDTNPAVLQRWHATRTKLALRGVAIPEAPHADRNFRAMMHSLLSARTGTPVGWEFTSLIEVAHHLAQDYPQHLLAFGYALDLYGHKELLKMQDTSGKWKSKCAKFRPKIKARDPNYVPDERSMASLVFLFPEIGQRASAFLRKKAGSEQPKLSASKTGTGCESGDVYLQCT